MVMVNILAKTVLTMKVAGRKISSMEKVSSHGQMVLNMKENLSLVRRKGMVFCASLKAVSTKANSVPMKLTDMVSITGWMVSVTKDSGVKIR